MIRMTLHLRDSDHAFNQGRQQGAHHLYNGSSGTFLPVKEG